MTEVKFPNPCPKCGARPCVTKIQDPHVSAFEIECCGQRSASVVGDAPGPDDVVTRWNEGKILGSNDRRRSKADDARFHRIEDRMTEEQRRHWVNGEWDLKGSYEKDDRNL